MKFYTVTYGDHRISVLAPSKSEAVLAAGRLYRKHNGLPPTFSVFHLYGGAKVVNFQPGDSFPAEVVTV